MTTTKLPKSLVLSLIRYRNKHAFYGDPIMFLTAWAHRTQDYRPDLVDFYVTHTETVLDWVMDRWYPDYA